MTPDTATDTAVATDTTAADAAVAASTEATTKTEAPASETTTAATETPKKTTLTGEPAASTATVEDAKPTPVTYELKLPENATIDASTIERTTAFARESGLSPEVAQKSLEFLNTEIASRESAYLESTKPGGAEWTNRVTEFETQALADPEIGGTPDKLKANAAEASRVLNEFFPPAVSDFLYQTGYGSHPDVIKGFLKFAKATSEGQVIASTKPLAVSKDDPRIMYDNPTSQTSKT